MYPIGIIIPTLLEADFILKKVSVKDFKIIQGKPFYNSSILDIDAVISISGIGKANAAHSVGLMIELYKPSRLINIGVAGAYANSGLDIGELAIAEREIYADEGLMTSNGQFASMQSLNLPLANINDKRFFNEFETFVPESIKVYLKRGTFLTVSSCTGSSKMAETLEKKYNAICENMEGCAMAHIASLSGLPFIEIRAISNIIKDRDKTGLNKSDLLKSAEKVQEYLLSNFAHLIK
ncbi:MAG: futalosine hydrolase [Thermodesulfovibrionales bacterium]|nr:futalosine hydrolase [Thermodesulfovibrionales bacterium]